MIEAKLILYTKSIRSASFEFIQYLQELFLLIFKIVGDGVEQKIVKLMVFEEDACTRAKDVFFIGNEKVD